MSINEKTYTDEEMAVLETEACDDLDSAFAELSGELTNEFSNMMAELVRVVDAHAYKHKQPNERLLAKIQAYRQVLTDFTAAIDQVKHMEHKPPQLVS